MLISCLAEVKRRGSDIRTTGLFGQELITITAAIARMNLVIPIVPLLMNPALPRWRASRTAPGGRREPVDRPLCEAAQGAPRGPGRDVEGELGRL